MRFKFSNGKITDIHDWPAFIDKMAELDPQQIDALTVNLADESSDLQTYDALIDTTESQAVLSIFADEVTTFTFEQPFNSAGILQTLSGCYTSVLEIERDGRCFLLKLDTFLDDDRLEQWDVDKGCFVLKLHTWSELWNQLLNLCQGVEDKAITLFLDCLEEKKILIVFSNWLYLHRGISYFASEDEDDYPCWGLFNPKISGIDVIGEAAQYLDGLE